MFFLTVIFVTSCAAPSLAGERDHLLRERQDNVDGVGEIKPNHNGSGECENDAYLGEHLHGINQDRLRFVKVAGETPGWGKPCLFLSP